MTAGDVAGPRDRRARVRAPGERPRMPVRGGVAVVVVALLVSTLAPGAAADPSLRSLLTELDVSPPGSRTASAFSLGGLDGARVSLVDLRGRVALLYFWATWCPYCARELPSTIAEVHRRYHDRGLEVVAVNIQESRSRVADWVHEKRLAFPIALDVDGVVSEVYKVTATPTVYLVGRDGQLVGVAVGTRAWTSEKGRRLLEALVTR